jgi:HAMP domain-containing protein/HPt (histidine-containing phosphotransfer) domain-containing protein
LSLGTKLAVATALVLAIVSSIVFQQLTAGAREMVFASKDSSAKLVTDLLVASVVAPLDFGDDKDVSAQLENLRVDGDVTYAAVWRPNALQPCATFGDVGAALVTMPDPAGAGSARSLADRLEFVRRVTRPDGSLLGTAVVRFTLVPEQAKLRAQRRDILWATVGTALLLAVIILGMVRLQIVRPLERLVLASRRLQNGEMSARVDVSSRDEVGRLATAFNTMAIAIRDREEVLADTTARLQELFDNMRQAILVFGRDGRVEEASSRQAAVLFGPEVASQSIRTLLYEGAPEWSPARQAFEAWLDAAFDMPASEWSLLAELAPVEVRRDQGGKPQWLELQFTPIVRNDRVDRIMLLATDLTDKRQLEQAAQTAEVQHAKRMASMRRLVAGGGQLFTTFLSSAEARVESAMACLARPAVGAADLAEMFRSVHTIRGEARAFEMAELAAECQGVERILRDLRDGAGSLDAPRTRDILARLQRAREHLVRARELFVEASPIGRAVLDQMTVRRSDVQRLAELLATSQASIRRALANLTSRPFGECVAGLEASAPVWAEQVAKKANVRVLRREARVPAKFAPSLSAALSHLVRNAIAHGIEAPGVRRAAGKNEVGTVSISATETASCLEVRVEEDGAGLDEEAIVARAIRLGLPSTSPRELVFVDGLSTLASAGELAGQGVGLSAVRASLRPMGADVSVERTEAGCGAVFLIRVPLVEASESMLSDRPEIHLKLSLPPSVL